MQLDEDDKTIEVPEWLRWLLVEGRFVTDVLTRCGGNGYSTVQESLESLHNLLVHLCW